MREFWAETPVSARVAFAGAALGVLAAAAAIAVAGALGGTFGAAAMALAFALGLAPIASAGLMLRAGETVKMAGILVSGVAATFLLSSLLNLASGPQPPGTVLADFFDVLVFLGAIADGLVLGAVALLAAAEVRVEASGTRSPRISAP